MSKPFHLTRASYYLDFVLAPLYAAGLLGWEIAQRGVRWQIAADVIFGVIAWTLAEYLIHRFAFHNLAVLRRLHDVHHTYPAAYIGVASYGTSIAFALAWLFALVTLGVSQANAITAGLWLGYLYYIAIHDRMHHVSRLRFGRYVAFMWRHHAGHHRGGETNFGVSSPVWDIVFRTKAATR